MPNTAHNTHQWHPEWEKLRDFKFTQLTELAKSRLMDLVFERRDLGRYGLGKTRTLAEFAKFSGIDYAKCEFVQAYQPKLNVQQSPVEIGDEILQDCVPTFDSGQNAQT